MGTNGYFRNKGFVSPGCRLAKLLPLQQLLPLLLGPALLLLRRAGDTHSCRLSLALQQYRWPSHIEAWSCRSKA
jgi:hypothetical protein